MTESTNRIIQLLVTKLGESNGYEVWQPQANEVVGGEIIEVYRPPDSAKRNRSWLLLHTTDNRLLKIRIPKRLQDKLEKVGPGWVAAFKCIRKIGTSYQINAVFAEPGLDMAEDLKHLEVF